MANDNNSVERKSVNVRTAVVFILTLVIGVLIIIKGFQTAVTEREPWLKRVKALKIEDRIINPKRGNIFASDGSLMASSIPQFNVHIDFQASRFSRDTLIKYLPELSEALATQIGEHSASGWRNHIMGGLNKRGRNFKLVKRRISYTEMKLIRTFPFLNRSPNHSGLKFAEMAQRKKPFGLLAARTIGDVYGDQAMGGKNGLELAFDSLLRGTTGVGTRQKLAGRYITIPEKSPIDGADVTTTIDIAIQDITEQALLDKLKEIDAESGTAIVMEVKTGAVVAIANLGRTGSGVYGETQNFALTDKSEPGSTFKVASMMVALDKGLVNPQDTIDVGNGVWYYKGVRMTDHNWNKGGYGKITAAQSLWYSSNIGIAKIVLGGFENNPAEFVDALYEMKINQKLDLQIPGAGFPTIRHPNDTTGFWSKTSLPWMSFGYETQIPPIYILNFFNAIANNGKMMKPYFVREIKREGRVIEKFGPETVHNKICKSTTLPIIHQMLEDVVNQETGTGYALHSTRLKLAGKTGTALISKGGSGYTAAGRTHQVSFCGYFPADKPVYSCIVVIRNPRNGYPSGGGMSGVVFKNIAERTYAQGRFFAVDVNRDSTALFVPRVKNGDYQSANYLLRKLDLPFEDKNREWVWSTARIEDKKITMRELIVTEGLVPSVIGMGAKDAVYLLENTGMRVHLNGKGRVVSQSKSAGHKYKKGDLISIELR